MIHPILAALPDGTNAEEFVQNLGFEVDFQFDGSSDLPDGLTLDDWKITIPEGFKLAGKWEADSGADDYFVACFLKPTTPLATAIWLIGLGQQVQDNAPEPHYSYLDTSDEHQDPIYTGRYSTAEDAFAAANKNLPIGTMAEVGRFVQPLASRFIDPDSLLDSMREAADPLLPDEDWPRLHTPERDTLHNSLELLIDGWAASTGNEPAFGIES